MSHQDKLNIEETLHTQYQFDEFIDENPVVLERVARGEARGEARGKIEGLQEAILNILQVRFAALATTSQAQQAIAHTHNLEKLKELQRDLLLAPNEQAARAVLKLPHQGDLL